MINLQDKYVQHDVFDLYLYNDKDDLIATINTVRENEFTITRKGRILFKLFDATIDKDFLNYMLQNNKFEGRITGKSFIYNLKFDERLPIKLETHKVQLLYYKIKKKLDCSAEVDILFEIFRNDAGTGINIMV